MMVVRNHVLVALAVLVVVAGAAVFSWAQEGAVKIRGVNAPDEHPNGCIDCHRDAGEGRDYRLNVSLKEIAGHPDITSIVKVLPKDCGICHRPDVPAGALNHITHRVHYQNPDENHFISAYQGSCLECHSLNVATGVMGMKEGDKNW
jgi:hypothetical protein